MLNIAYVHTAHIPFVIEHYHHISLVSDHVSKTSNTLNSWYFITAPLSTIKCIRHFEDIVGTVVVEICIVVSVYFLYCFIYWADTSLLSYICLYIWESQRSVTGRILVEYTSQYLINTVWRRHVILDLGRRFLDMFKTLRPPIFMLFARRITPDQLKPTCDSLAPYFCIFILSTCESTKKLLKTCIHLLLPSTAEPDSWKCSKTSLEPILLILLFPITKTCRALEWDLLAILPRDWSYTGRIMVLSPRVTEALSN